MHSELSGKCEGAACRPHVTAKAVFEASEHFPRILYVRPTSQRPLAFIHCSVTGKQAKDSQNDALVVGASFLPAAETV